MKKYNTIWDFLKDIEVLNIDIDGNIEDGSMESLYIYLKEKSLMVNRDFYKLQLFYEQKDFFNCNVRILIELMSNKAFFGTFRDELRKSVILLSTITRDQIYENKEKNKLDSLKLKIINQLLYISGYYESELAPTFYKKLLVLQELEHRNMDPNSSNKSKIENNYKDYLFYDYVIYILYFLCEKEEALYDADVLDSARNFLENLNKLVVSYSEHDIYLDSDYEVIDKDLKKTYQRLKKEN